MPLSVFDVCLDNMIYFAWISLFLGESSVVLLLNCFGLMLKG